MADLIYKGNPPWKVPDIFRTHEKPCFKTK